MNVQASAIVCDNGEPNLVKCLQSLRAQTIPLTLIVASGPKTDGALARKYADKVMKPVKGIGRARVQAILEASTPYILSCDSDTIYAEDYAQFALEDLKLFNAVQASAIRPLENNILHWVEAVGASYSPIFGFEFALAFRRQAFLDAEIQTIDCEDPRNDIGYAVKFRLFPLPDPRMVCWSRFPTYGARLASEYLPPLMIGLVPLGFTLGIPLVNEFLKPRD
jgi:glycosyltransferase involved in cell wall biosynthesis